MARIVVVDDSIFLAKKIKKWLISEGHDVVGLGENGFEGEDLYFEHKPDLITLDITMPMRDGRECLAEIINKDPEAKIVIVSALDDKEIIVECLNKGAKGFIEKPLEFDSDEFCNKFRQTIENAIEKE